MQQTTQTQRQWQPQRQLHPFKHAISRSLPWDTVIPASFFLAAAICWTDPTLAPSVMFLFVGCTSLFFESLAAYFAKPATQYISTALTDSLNSLTEEENSERTEQLLQALAGTISRTLQSDALTSTVKESMIEMLTSDELHQTTIQTLQRAMVIASEDVQFRDTVMEVGKRAFVGALSDQKLVEELMTSIMDAIVLASQNDKLRKALLEIVTQGMADAFEDDRFVTVVRRAVRDTLQDKELYQASARGLIAAANPFASRR